MRSTRKASRTEQEIESTDQNKRSKKKATVKPETPQKARVLFAVSREIREQEEAPYHAKNTRIHAAVIDGSKRTVRQILKKVPLAGFMPDSNNITPAQLAAFHSQPAIFRMFLENDVDFALTRLRTPDGNESLYQMANRIAKANPSDNALKVLAMVQTLAGQAFIKEMHEGKYTDHTLQGTLFVNYNNRAQLQPNQHFKPTILQRK